jgi:hypothetical protein
MSNMCDRGSYMGSKVAVGRIGAREGTCCPSMAVEDKSTADTKKASGLGIWLPKASGLGIWLSKDINVPKIEIFSTAAVDMRWEVRWTDRIVLESSELASDAKLSEMEIGRLMVWDEDG